MSDSWVPVPDGSDFTLANLPYGVVRDSDSRSRVVVRVGERVVPVGDVVEEATRDLFERNDLNVFLAAGPAVWRETRERLLSFVTDPAHACELPAVDDVEVLLPVAIGDYVDFYCSLHHATNLGRILRPDGEPLLPNWRHLPVGYHGRSGTVVVSGTPVRRPAGLVVDGEGVRRGPSAQLDFELEVGFIVGVGTRPGEPIAPDDAGAHVFGAVLVNDWSARDIQAFEYQPLGPFLGKSFSTTISPWVVTLDALTPFLVTAPSQIPPPDPFLRATKPWAIDIELTAELNDTTITHTNFRDLYWTFAQQLAHMTSNGATARSGDLFASGTVSGPAPGEHGSLIESTWRGRDPVVLADGSFRAWLDDGDTVRLRGWSGAGPSRVGFGEAVGTIYPSTEAGRS
jgi:fumarylacetoacetase